ncbi:unnamed protein product [Clavelina lepadiformis]|uniref:Uncharacterized protein n=1 Tax=Clavelina lepadiformis TaxID=159417 RepID=A0ABP0F8I6_CLALP
MEITFLLGFVSELVAAVDPYGSRSPIDNGRSRFRTNSCLICCRPNSSIAPSDTYLGRIELADA